MSFQELKKALDFWAKYLEDNASQSERPEYQKGKAAAYRNLASHIQLNGDLQSFIDTQKPYNREFGA
jgi:hypothetical protein